MELLIIRHGQSEADLLEVHEGRADFPLTDLGREQAKKLAGYIKEKHRPDLILASPLKRALETARILQEKAGCPLVLEENLMEYNNGVLAGLPREEAAVKYPLPPGGRPPHIPIEGGESDLEFRFRSEAVLQRIFHEYGEYERIAVVSHGGTISNLIQSFLNLPAVNGYVFPTGDTGYHVLELRGKNRIIWKLNCQAHLD